MAVDMFDYDFRIGDAVRGPAGIMLVVGSRMSPFSDGCIYLLALLSCSGNVLDRLSCEISGEFLKPVCDFNGFLDDRFSADVVTRVNSTGVVVYCFSDPIAAYQAKYSDADPYRFERKVAEYVASKKGGSRV